MVKPLLNSELPKIYYDAIPFAGKTDIQIMRLHSRGAQPPRLDSPHLSDDTWRLILDCWEREALIRPDIQYVRGWLDLLTK